MARVPNRRKANDLYVRGVPLSLDDGTTDWVEELDDDGEVIINPETDRPKLVEVPAPPVVLWVSKLSNNEMGIAMKYASVAQSEMLAGKRDHDSEHWQAVRGTLANLDRANWEVLIIEQAMHGRLEIIEARTQAATVMDENGEEQPGEWAKDNYLEGLFVAWIEGLQAAQAVDPDDEKALRVLSEIDRFNQQVKEQYEYELEVEKQNLAPWSDDTILDRATEVLIDGEGIEIWNEEYIKRVVFLAARDCDGPDPDRPGKCVCRGSRAKHREPHFESIEDVAEMDERIRRRIYDAYCAVQVDPTEGKGSPARPASSTLSALLSGREDSVSSSREA